MKISTKRLLIWTPRILGILFALFVSLFALDVFGKGASFGQAVGAFLRHLLPVYSLVIGLALGWRWAWVGAVTYRGFAMAYLVLFKGQLPGPVYWLMAGPVALIGLLFLIDWRYRAELRSSYG